ncbi:MAG TPA: tetratricopeptide repeat protein [Pirellulales bacterium]|nr:tetratricopeptide repeat protein [Pirellulales bacterium]
MHRPLFLGRFFVRPLRAKAIFACLALLLVGTVFVGAVFGPRLLREYQFRRHMRTARIAFEQFVADNAVNELNAAVALRPDSAEAEYLLGVANRKAGHLDDVRPHLNRAAELGWPGKDIRFQLTLLAFQAGDHRAEAELKQTIGLAMPDDVAEETYESLAIGYLSEYRLNEADVVLDYWVRWRPERIRPKLLRAEIFGVTRLHDAQMEQYKQILALDPDNYPAHLGSAHILLDKHDVDKAMAEYRWCREHWPGDLSPPLGIAGCYQHRGELGEARKILEDLLTKRLSSDQRAHVLAELGQVAYQDRAFEDAIPMLTESLELNPYDERAEYALGMCLVKVGRRKEAEEHTQRSKEIEKARQQLADVEVQILSQPADADLRYAAGMALAKLGSPKASAAMMLAALRWDPTHPRAHAELAKYYQGIGRSDLAKQHESLAVNDVEKRASDKVHHPGAHDGS